MAIGIHRAAHATPLYRQNLALTSPTSGGRTISIVRSRTQAIEEWNLKGSDDGVSLRITGFLDYAHRPVF
jgi:hypothetical protein